MKWPLLERERVANSGHALDVRSPGVGDFKPALDPLAANLFASFGIFAQFHSKKCPKKAHLKRSAPEKVHFFSFLLPSQFSYFPSKLGKEAYF